MCRIELSTAAAITSQVPIAMASASGSLPTDRRRATPSTTAAIANAMAANNVTPMSRSRWSGPCASRRVSPGGLRWSTVWRVEVLSRRPMPL